MQEDSESFTDHVDPSVIPEPDSTTSTLKEPRRGSISISRFGQATADHTPAVSRMPSTRPSRSSSMVSKTPFYQLDTEQTQVYTDSTDSFASLDSGDEDPSIHHEDKVESSMFFEPGKRSISKAISRRLSRAREPPQVLPSASFVSETLVIGVAVEEATVEHRSDSGDWHSADNVSTTTQVYSGALRSRRSAPGLYQKATTSSPFAWVSRAKDIVSQFRRKSIASLNTINATEQHGHHPVAVTCIGCYAPSTPSVPSDRLALQECPRTA